MLLVQIFWRLFGIFTFDLSYNKFQYVYSILLIITCMYNFIMSPQVLCKMDHWCDIFSSSLLSTYDKTLATITVLSRIALTYKSEHNLSKYNATIDAFEVYSPVSPAELKSYKMFSFGIVFLYIVMVIPINVLSLYYIYFKETDHDNSILVYFAFFYVQNLSMCCIETQFVTQCFKMYTKFRGINGELNILKEENINHSKYPFIMGFSVTMWMNNYEQPRPSVTDDRDFYRPRFRSQPTANAVEILRIKHWLVRQSVNALNDLFGIHMGLSVFYIWVVALFDIFYEIFHNAPSELLIYCWLFQYSLRLLLIILLPHYTTKQVRLTTRVGFQTFF